MKTIISKNFDIKKAKKRNSSRPVNDLFDMEKWEETREQRRKALVQIYKVTGKASFVLKSYDWVNLPEFTDDIDSLAEEMNGVAVSALSASNYLIPKEEKIAQSLLMTDYPEMPEKLPDPRRVRIGIRMTKELYKYLDDLFEKINMVNQQTGSTMWHNRLNTLSDHIHYLSDKAKKRNQELFDIWEEFERVSRVRKLQREVNRKHYY